MKKNTFIKLSDGTGFYTNESLNEVLTRLVETGKDGFIVFSATGREENIAVKITTIVFFEEVDAIG